MVSQHNRYRKGLICINVAILFTVDYLRRIFRLYLVNRPAEILQVH